MEQCNARTCPDRAGSSPLPWEDVAGAPRGCVGGLGPSAGRTAGGGPVLRVGPCGYRAAMVEARDVGPGARVELPSWRVRWPWDGPAAGLPVPAPEPGSRAGARPVRSAHRAGPAAFDRSARA
ncbi:hypothetical protein ATKI12_6771 [Kitasatospora sp. Ki12]